MTERRGLARDWAGEALLLPAQLPPSSSGWLANQVLAWSRLVRRASRDAVRLGSTHPGFTMPTCHYLRAAWALPAPTS